MQAKQDFVQTESQVSLREHPRFEYAGAAVSIIHASGISIGNKWEYMPRKLLVCMTELLPFDVPASRRELKSMDKAFADVSEDVTSKSRTYKHRTVNASTHQKYVAGSVPKLEALPDCQGVEE